MDKQLQPKRPQKALAPLNSSSVSIEDEGVIREVFGRQLLRSCHCLECERIDLRRCRGGNTGLGVWDRPSSESHHQSGGADCEQCLCNMNSPSSLICAQ